MNDQLIQALKEIKSLREGVDILNDAKRFKSAITDKLGPGSDLKRMRKCALGAVEEGIYTRLSKAASTKDLNSAALRMVEILRDIGTDEIAAKEVVGAFAALFTNEPIFTTDIVNPPPTATPPPNPPLPSQFIPVSNISGVPTEATAGTALSLMGMVAPNNATNKNIVWSIKAAGSTGAVITGSTLNATSEGTITITATITNGAMNATNYIQNYDIIIRSNKRSFIRELIVNHLEDNLFVFFTVLLSPFFIFFGIGLLVLLNPDSNSFATSAGRFYDNSVMNFIISFLWIFCIIMGVSGCVFGILGLGFCAFRKDFKSSFFKYYFIFAIIQGIIIALYFSYMPNIIYRPVNVLTNFVSGKPVYSERFFYDRGFLGTYKITGKGKILFRNGDVYEGDFLRAMMHGYGGYIFANGDEYNGYFFNGKMHGYGKLTRPDGTVQEGKWGNGDFIGK